MKPFRFMCASIILISAFHASLFAQTKPKLAFEVASIKPSPLSSLISEAQSGKINLPMRMDGAQVDLKFLSLKNMIVMAYKVKPHQIMGPDWMSSALFEIHAKLPEGSTKEQIPEMMQSLLAERFKMTFHRETKEQPVYALIVSKDGPKMEKAVEEPATPAPAGDSENTPDAKKDSGKELLSMKTPNGEVKMKQEGNGISMDVGEAGKMHMTMGENGSMRWELPKMKMSDFADMLSQFTDRPVVDMTELKDPYKVTLELPLQDLMNLARKMMPQLGALSGGGAPSGTAPSSGLGGVNASDPSGSGIFHAVQQLGLKLDSRKMPIETLVIDQIEKEPTEN
jgi:uncharacterized protein (TIGR03435 family)